MDEDQISRIAKQVRSDVSGSMRAAVGDRTPAQWDRAERLGNAIEKAVVKNLRGES